MARCCGSRGALHARIAETLESQFADIVERQPELLARHYTEAGLIEKSARLWGKAGQRSLARSAMGEAAEQLRRALGQLATLPSTPALRAEQVKLQVALINPLTHIRGYAAPETKAATEQARLLIEQAEALGEAPEDPLLLFSVLYGLWITNVVAFKGHVVHQLAEQFLALAKKQGTTTPLIVGHRLMGMSFLFTGDVAASRTHLDRAIALYNPIEHRPLVSRFGQDIGVAILSFRSLALWMLGYPVAALADIAHALKDAREIGQAATLMYVLTNTSLTLIFIGSYTTAKERLDELLGLANEKGASYWKARGLVLQGCVLSATGEAADAVHIITSGLAQYRLTGATVQLTSYLSYLAKAHAELSQFDDAWRAEVNRIAALQQRAHGRNRLPLSPRPAPATSVRFPRQLHWRSDDGDRNN
jgi:hypothetical protein